MIHYAIITIFVKNACIISKVNIHNILHDRSKYFLKIALVARLIVMITAIVGYWKGI